ncbi:MAG: hypothetical protein QM296_12585 [Bacillota bacterium]|nr:hypothetical protein [Bacillota bacterium]
MIEVQGLSKQYRVRGSGAVDVWRPFLSRSYDVIQALDDVSFRIADGEMVGYIGPNGAGSWPFRPRIGQKIELCQRKVTQLQKLANPPSTLTKKRVVSVKGDTTPKVGKSILIFVKKSSCVSKT